MRKNTFQKHPLLLETAQKLFWKHGFKRVSIEEICKKTGISKMTFYRHYANKTALAKEIIDNLMGENLQKFNDIMTDSLTSVEEKMQQFVHLKFEGTKEISMEFINDLYSDPDSELKDYMTLKTQESWAVILTTFKKAQHDGWLRQDFKPEFLLILSLKMTALFNDAQIKALYPEPQDFIMEATKLITYGICPHNKPHTL